VYRMKTGGKMKIEEAIEIKRRQKEGYTTYSSEVIEEADRLGIEALEAIKKMRQYPFPEEILKLPSETKK